MTDALKSRHDLPMNQKARLAADPDYYDGICGIQALGFRSEIERVLKPAPPRTWRVHQDEPGRVGYATRKALSNRGRL